MNLINETNIEKAKNKIKKSEPPILVQARDDKFNRKLIEYGKFQVLLSPEKGNRKNKIKNIDSGFNHVLAKIATKNKIAIGIDLKEISKLSKKEKADRLSKIKQNIKTARKAKTKLALINTKEEKNARAFLVSLGASSQQAKNTALLKK